MSTDRSSLRFVTQSEDQKIFFTTLTKRVNRYFRDRKISKKGDSTMAVKTIVMLSVYILPFAAILIFQPPLWASLPLWILTGLGMAGVGMSVMHDAIHGAYSKKKSVNNLFGYSLNLVGGSYFNWRLQHNVLHHTYTNISDWDEDISGKGTMKLEPHKTSKWIHKFQWIYAFFFYGIMTLYWAVAKDFIQFAKYTMNGVNTNTASQNLRTLIGIVWVKVVYFSVFIGIPVFILGLPFIHILIGFLLMHFVAGIVLTVIFQLAHTVEGTDHPLPDNKGNIENAWAIHQMHTTVNFSPDNPFLNWYVGGLNYQIEHHLFPQICHVHYPKIAPIVKKTADEFGVPYNVNKTFFDAINSHIRLLKQYGKLPNMNEAIV